MECKDEDGAIPLHDACAGGKAVLDLCCFVLFSYFCAFAGKVEIVQMLLNAASEECVKRMLETTDVDGDTV